jgi:hypothetical protein
MKVTVNIDCTPEEARDFLGLPNVKPMQDAFMGDLENLMRSGMSSVTPEALMSAWNPTTMKNTEQLQKLFWSNMQNMVSGFLGSTNPLLTVNGKKQNAA